MKEQVKAVLRGTIPNELADDIVEEFVQTRDDLATLTLGRTAAGKFVETFVQILQYLEEGTYQHKPDVDAYLRKVQDHNAGLDVGLRICGARIGRAMYALRNKRSIAHKGAIDPNRYDLAQLFASAQWIMAELLRNASGVSMDEAGSLIARIQAPVSPVVEDFGDAKLVLHDLSASEEILVLLRDDYPERTSRNGIFRAMPTRHESTVRKAITKLAESKLVVGNAASGYLLTRRGLKHADKVVLEIVKKPAA